MILVFLYRVKGKVDFVNLGIYKIGFIIFVKIFMVEWY